MNSPTRGQWRGYAVLCVLLLVALLLTIVIPKRRSAEPRQDYSALAEAIELQGDSLVADAQTSRQRTIEQWRRDTLQRREGLRETTSYGARPYAWREKKRVVVELNSADTLDLQQLHGVGPAFARRIVRYRQSLGGFVCREQLLEVYGMDEERYNGFVDQLTLDTSRVARIDINSVGIDDLKRHPYLDYYQAKSIVQYRDQHGPYRCLQDLLLVNLMDETTVTKIKDYVQFN